MANSDFKLNGVPFTDLFEFDSSNSIADGIRGDHTNVVFTGSISGIEESIGDYQLLDGSRYGGIAGNCQGRFETTESSVTTSLPFTLADACAKGTALTIPVGDNLQPSSAVTGGSVDYGTSKNSSSFTEPNGGYSSRFTQNPTSYRYVRNYTGGSSSVDAIPSLNTSTGAFSLYFRCNAGASVGTHSRSCVITVYATNSKGESIITSRRAFSVSFTVNAAKPTVKQDPVVIDLGSDIFNKGEQGVVSNTRSFSLNDGFYGNGDDSLSWTSRFFGGEGGDAYGDIVATSQGVNGIKVEINVITASVGDHYVNAYIRSKATNSGGESDNQVKFRLQWFVTITDEAPN